MDDKHPKFQKILYIVCWVVLAAILLIGLIKAIGG